MGLPQTGRCPANDIPNYHQNPQQAAKYLGKALTGSSGSDQQVLCKSTQLTPVQVATDEVSRHDTLHKAARVKPCKAQMVKAAQYERVGGIWPACVAIECPVHTSMSAAAAASRAAWIFSSGCRKPLIFCCWCLSSFSLICIGNRNSWALHQAPALALPNAPFSSSSSFPIAACVSPLSLSPVKHRAVLSWGPSVMHVRGGHIICTYTEPRRRNA